MTWKDEQEAEINRAREEEEEEEEEATARWLPIAAAAVASGAPSPAPWTRGAGQFPMAGDAAGQSPLWLQRSAPPSSGPARPQGGRDIISVISPAISESCRPCLSRGGRAGGRTGGRTLEFLRQIK